jgi:hypothetical protein
MYASIQTHVYPRLSIRQIGQMSDCLPYRSYFRKNLQNNGSSRRDLPGR